MSFSERTRKNIDFHMYVRQKSFWSVPKFQNNYRVETIIFILDLHALFKDLNDIRREFGLSSFNEIKLNGIKAKNEELRKERNKKQITNERLYFFAITTFYSIQSGKKRPCL